MDRLPARRAAAVHPAISAVQRGFGGRPTGGWHTRSRQPLRSKTGPVAGAASTPTIRESDHMKKLHTLDALAATYLPPRSRAVR
jgi:hypothetical protein